MNICERAGKINSKNLSINFLAVDTPTIIGNNQNNFTFINLIIINNAKIESNILFLMNCSESKQKIDL